TGYVRTDDSDRQKWPMPVRPLNAIAGLAQRLILPTDEEFVFEPMDPLDIFGRDEWRRNASRSARARTAERVGGGDAEFVGRPVSKCYGGNPSVLIDLLDVFPRWTTTLALLNEERSRASAKHAQPTTRS